MRVLLMDRSSREPGLLVWEGEKVLCRLLWTGLPMLAPAWMEEIRNALETASVTVESIDRFVCGLGPGSFSGIRACLSALNGMALPGAKPVLGIASAAGMAASASQDGLVSVVGDARRNRLWIVTYRMDGNRVTLADGSVPSQTADDFQLTEPERLSEAVPDHALVVSPDWERISACLESAFPPERLIRRPVLPDLDRLADVVRENLADCRMEPLPIYLHPAVAVTRKEQG